MGYPRFGSILALILVRLCIGRGYSWEAPELQVLGLVLLAEMVEAGIDPQIWLMLGCWLVENHTKLEFGRSKTMNSNHDVILGSTSFNTILVGGDNHPK